MKLTFTIDLNADEEAELARILNKDQAKLADAVGPYAKAATEEYVRMILGQRVFTRGSDMREYRLFLLIRNSFGNAIPDEQTVCALFQCTLSQGRALIRAVMSKYQYELRKAVDATLSKTLGTVRKSDDGLVVSVNNESLVAELNKVLASIDVTQAQVLKKTGTLATYVLQRSAYEKLCAKFDVNPIKAD